MLHAKKSGLASRRYEITSDGKPLTVVEARSGGRFELDGATYQLRRPLGRAYQLLSADGSVLATAARPGDRTWSVESGGEHLRFERAALRGRDHTQVDAAGNAIGSIAVGHSGIDADLAGTDLRLQVFAIAALAMRLRRRRSAIAAGAVSGG
ncbi:hypothetical protein [Amycolatopsis benzoatilytica]|uniref:hypothetical protein n=1 Tax=Amycolatopsis benzoatilytica TaxID=346045 RepID=UPI00037A30CB|nr:hypothetical protein [Amycolatopsis benzoatilytica]